jgi:hypothetical protein
MNNERIMRLKISTKKDQGESLLYFGFPYYEGDTDNGFGFRISGYGKYPDPMGPHYTMWIPIEELVSMEIKPLELQSTTEGRGNKNNAE